MKFLLASSLFATVASSTVSAPVTNAFSLFQQKFNKSYTGAEWAKRLVIFADNLEKVNSQNEEHILLGGEAVFGITKFMDLTPQEFKSTYLNYIPRNESSIDRVTPVLDRPAADEVDWRTKGAVTAVKDQGQCGSCWAFSTTEAIESYAFLSTKYSLLELSPQQINSCDDVDDGCNGGNTESAYEYVIDAGGIEGEASYPYYSGEGVTGKCKFNIADVKVKISGYKSISQGEHHLKAALNNGPVSVCLAADSFQTYSSGILKKCPGRIDHCVQAVGYSGSDYWIVRNSWGDVWGEEGYIRIEMGKDLCHIADDVTYPTF